MTPEGKVKKAVKKALAEHFGSDCYRFMPVQTGYGTRTLDFLLCVCGVFVAIETKAPGETYTGLQETIRDNILAAGGLVFLVDGDESLELAITRIKAKQVADRPR